MRASPKKRVDSRSTGDANRWKEKKKSMERNADSKTADSGAKALNVVAKRAERRDNALFLRREVAIRLVRAFWQGRLVESVDRIPFDMRPKNSDAPFRCCVYKERAILRSRCISALGFRVEEDDEYKPLSEYAKEALEREKVEEPVLTVVDVACKGCVESRFMVTDLCQGCIARPCLVNCNFGAVSIVDGKSRIDRTQCKNCGRCMNTCPYGAIVKIHVPCEEACPVGAIRKSEEGRAEIDFEKCTSCGRCIRACPFGAVMARSQIIDVARRLVEQKKRVVALIAPAIVGQFPHPVEKIAGALLELGFADVLNVATGADRTSVFEAEEFVERMERGERFMTTSCCPAYVETANKHVPELKPFVSQTPTPASYTAQYAKERDSDCVTVFIGPCVAKRVEGLRDPSIDYVLTFKELGSLFAGAGIEVGDAVPREFPVEASAQGRGFAITGGVADAVKTMVETKNIDSLEVKPICVDGLSPAGIKQLRAFATTACPGNLVEVMTCEGGCVGGAGAVANPKIATREVKANAAAAKSLPETLANAAADDADKR